MVVLGGRLPSTDTCCAFVVVANPCWCSAIRILGGVLESLHCHTSDYASGEGSGYLEKIQDVRAGLMDALVRGMKRKGLSDASQRYGTRALHRCLQTLPGTCTRPSRNLKEEEGEDEEGEGKGAGGGNVIKRKDSNRNSGNSPGSDVSSSSSQVIKRRDMVS